MAGASTHYNRSRVLACAGSVAANLYFSGAAPMRRLAWLLVLLLIAGAAAYGWIVYAPLALPQTAYAFTVQPGATLRSVARAIAGSGRLHADRPRVGGPRVPA